jgi:RHS repeat-associated protein
VTRITDAIGGQTSFSYDPNGRALSLTDALTHPTTNTYDTSDRVATRADPLLHAEQYQYDANNNPSQVTDRNSQVTRSTYDALDRVSQVTFDDTSTITYTYDAGNRVRQIADSANGTITREYDSLDRLTQEASAEGTVTYTYDGDGRRATMTVAGQLAVSYGYDDAHRLTSVTQGALAVALTYADTNRRQTVTLPNGIVTTYAWDMASQLIGLTYTQGGNPLGTLTYTYDAVGNRASVGGTWARTGLPQAVTATYDAANRLIQWGGTSMSYDLNGNLASDGATTYTWNTRNEITGLSGGVGATFAYDGAGRRRGKTINGTATNFLYDGLNFVQELAGTVPTANLMTGLAIDETFARTDANGTSTPLDDALGSTLELADASGAPPPHYTFEPFGVASVSGATSTNAAQFTGRENDGTGLVYYRARYYNPAFERFMSEDPIGIRSGDINFYGYVAGNPLRYVDPLGLDKRGKKSCSDYPTIVVGGGASATAGTGLPFFGPFAGAGASGGLNLATFQVVVTVQGSEMVGVGAYGGVSLQVGATASAAGTPSGWSGTTVGAYAEANAGLGPSLGASVSANSQGVAGSAAPFAKVGAGYGVMVAGGASWSRTWATPGLWCN